MELRNEWKAFMEDDHGVGVIELVLVLVGILTPYHRVGIRCIELKYVDKQN